jgi:plastocyanin
MVNHAGGISLVTFVVAVAVSIGYYQFVYVPQANAKPQLKEEILEPPESVHVEIVEGSAIPSQVKNFVPVEARGTIEISNRVIWTNKDSVPHTVTTDDGYVDIINGKFDSLANEEGGGFVMPGEEFEFVFTKVGEYPYHCEPHPWMKGKVVIVENFA